MSHSYEPDTSYIYDADLSFDAASLEGVTKKPKHYIFRKMDSTSIETQTSPSKPSVPALVERSRAGVQCHHLALEIQSPKDPRRRGKTGWLPDVSSVLLSGLQYGLGDHQRGYHSNTYVTHLSYPESVADQPHESRQVKILRHIKH